MPPADPSLMECPPGRAIDLKGRRVWVETEGHGPALLLIAGGPGAPHNYLHHPVFSRLAQEFRLIYFDGIGAGRADTPKGADKYDFSWCIEELHLLRQALGLESWSVLGHSFGGIAAQPYAATYPNEVERLILVSTAHTAEMMCGGMNNLCREVEHQRPETWEAMQAVGRLGGDAPEELRARAREGLAELLYVYNPENAVGVEALSNPDMLAAFFGPRAPFEISGQLANMDFRRHWPKWRTPTLTIAGRFDRVFPPRYTLEQRDIPNSHFSLFEQSGHLPWLEEPDAFFDLVRRFLRDEPASS